MIPLPNVCSALSYGNTSGMFPAWELKIARKHARLVYWGMSESSIHFEVTNQLTELGRAADQVEEFLASHSVPMKTVHQVNLSLDEIITNIISYGFPGGGEHKISLRLQIQNGRLVVEVSDAGVEFNPLNKADPDTSKPIEEREIGGLGIFLARKSMDRLAYERSNGRNILRMEKALT